MAYILHYWRRDGNGQSELKAKRLKSINEAFPLSLPHNRPAGTVLITVDRSDNQSNIEKVIWTESGYVDPCNTP